MGACACSPILATDVSVEHVEKQYGFDSRLASQWSSDSVDFGNYACCDAAVRIPRFKAHEDAQYGPVLVGSQERIAALFYVLDLNSSKYLEKLELKKIVERYNGEKFNEAEFLSWFDVHGSRGSGPDGKLDLKEFGWYLADVARTFGASDEEARNALPAVLAEFAAKAEQIADEKQYGEVVDGFGDQIGDLFGALDKDGSNFLEKRELKRVVECYTGEKFNDSEFFQWFDVHGSQGDYSGPDGRLNLKEFGWYLADVALAFGGSTDEARNALPAVIASFTFATFAFG